MKNSLTWVIAWIFITAGGVTYIVVFLASPWPKTPCEPNHQYVVSWGKWPHEQELQMDSFQYHIDNERAITVWIDGRETLINCGEDYPKVREQWVQ